MIPLTLSGSMLLTARISAPDRPAAGVWVRLRVDTGATWAVVDPAVLRGLGLTPCGVDLVQGLGGPATPAPVYVVTLDLGASGRLDRVPVVALPIPADVGVQGLFGDNLLDRGLLIRDGPRRQWSFRLTRPSG